MLDLRPDVEPPRDKDADVLVRADWALGAKEFPGAPWVRRLIEDLADEVFALREEGATDADC